MRGLLKINPTDPQLARIQDNIDTVLRQILLCPIIDGTLVTGIALTTTNKDVAHGLGRTYQGYIIVGQDAAGVIYSPTGADKTKYVRLRTSTGTANVSIWVF